MRIEVSEIVKETFNFRGLGNKESYGAAIYIRAGGRLVYGGGESKYVDVNFGDVDSYGALCLTQVLHYFRIPICHVKPG